MQLFYLILSVMVIGASSFLLLRNSFTKNTRNLTAMSSTIKTLVSNAIKDNKVMVFSKSYCPYCQKTKNSLSDLNIEHTVFELDVSDFDTTAYNEHSTFSLSTSTM